MFNFQRKISTSLYGREQDELSHVLVTEQYERCSKFFYPTPASYWVEDREGNRYDAQEAVVTLAKIPFVRLRQGLPEDLLKGDVSFSGSVTKAQQDNVEPLLVLQEVPFLCVNDTVIKLKPADYLAYRWVLQRSLAGGLISRQDTQGNAQSFAIFYEQFTHKKFQESPISNGFKKAEVIDKVEIDMPSEMSGNWLSERMNGIKVAFKQALGIHTAKDYILQKSGKNSNLFYNIALTVEQVQGLHHSQGETHDSHTNQLSR